MNNEVNSFEFERDNSNFCIFGIKKSPFAIESRDKAQVISVIHEKNSIIITCDTTEIGGELIF